MTTKNTRRGWKLERKTGHVIVRFRGPRIGHAGIRAAVGTTAMLGGIFRLLSSPGRPDGPHASESGAADAERGEGSP